MVGPTCRTDLVIEVHLSESFAKKKDCHKNQMGLTWRRRFSLRHESRTKTFDFLIMMTIIATIESWGTRNHGRAFGAWNANLWAEILDLFLPMLQLLHQIRMLQIWHGLGIIARTIFVRFSIRLRRNVVLLHSEKNTWWWPFIMAKLQWAFLDTNVWHEIKLKLILNWYRISKCPRYVHT